MSSTLNRAEVIGHLGADPESRAVNQTTVTRMRVATSRKWKDAQGALQEETEWHSVTCWGQLAATAAKHLAKGRYVRCVGRMRSNKYTDKDGVVRWGFEVVADTIDFLDSRPKAPAVPGGGEPWIDDVPF